MVWEQTAGVPRKQVVETYQDQGYEGCVNGGSSSAREDHKHLIWNVPQFSSTGWRHHAYWQAKYNAFITALGAVLGVE